MKRIIITLAVFAAMSLPAMAGEMDREATGKAAPAPTVAQVAPTAGTELDGETPEQSWRRWGWGCGRGWGWGYSSFYRPWGGGWGCRSFYQPWGGGWGWSGGWGWGGGCW